MVIALPDPGRAATLDDLAELLRELKAATGDPSFEAITTRVNRGRPAHDPVGKTTVLDCFRPGRRRVNPELVTAVVEALCPDVGYVNQWRQALRVVSGAADPSHQVRVRDELPRDPSGFVGRTELIDGLLRPAGPAVTVLRGMAGVGKTQLALQLGRLLHADRSVDQVLYADLRGFHPDQPPAEPAAVLDGFLRLLGVPGQSTPAGLPERAALYRRRLTGRRVLVILDDADDDDQLAPLLASVAGCRTVVTSRRHLLAGSAEQIEVGLFTRAEARELLLTATDGRPDGDDEAALNRIIDRCGQLPLALALTAGQVRAKPGWRLGDHADWLDERSTAARLDPGIATALEVSYRALDPAARHLLRMLSTHPGPKVDAGAAAALAGLDRETAAGMLDGLSAQHLVQACGGGHVGLHDLIRRFARERSVDEDRHADRREAMSRLFDFYLVNATRDARRLQNSPPTEAGAWLDAELGNLVATTRVPDAGHHRPGYPGDLSAALEGYLFLRGQHEAATTVHGAAMAAAQRSGDDRRRAQALFRLARIENMQTRFHPAARLFAQAATLAATCGDEQTRLWAAIGQASAMTRTGRPLQARAQLRHLMPALDEFEPRMPMAARASLGRAELYAGLHREAARSCTEALARARELGDRRAEVPVLWFLAEAMIHQRKDLDRAEDHLARAQLLSHELANPSLKGGTLAVLGRLHLARHRLGPAAEAFRRAWVLLEENGHRFDCILATNGLGDVALAGGDPETAIAEYTAAAEQAALPDVGDLGQQARAEAGLGEAHRRSGRPADAREHYRTAMRLWTGVNDTEATRVAALLSGLILGDALPGNGPGRLRAPGRRPG